MTEPTHELEAYFAGDCTDEQLRAIEAWINADPANAQAFMHELHFRELVGERVREQRVDTRDVLAELARIEATAEPVTVAFNEGEPQPQPVSNNKAAMPPGQILSTTAYLLGQVLISKPAILAYAAAVVLLAAALLIPWDTSTDTPMPTASENPMPWDNEPTTAQTVATLTAAHNATWDTQPGDDLRPGIALASGQRLTLTQGFAEITTARGAVVILEAPATIELTDSDNALRLHTGKLVGICETESSKGFVVRTPHMDITDLGTRFGVDVSNPRATEVHVFEGVVEAFRADTPGGAEPTPSRLVQGQAARISRESDQIERFAADTSRFEIAPSRITRYKGSGVGLSAGEPDPRWTVLEADGKPLDQPVVLRVLNSNSTHGARNDPQRAQWVSWNPGLPPNDKGFNLFRFQTTITLPADFDPATDQLLLDYVADSGINQIAVNGRVTHDVSNPGTLNGDNTRRVVFIDGLTPGNNTFQFIVRNSTRRQVGPSNAVGIWADWELHQTQ